MNLPGAALPPSRHLHLGRSVAGAFAEQVGPLGYGLPSGGESPRSPPSPTSSPVTPAHAAAVAEYAARGGRGPRLCCTRGATLAARPADTASPHPRVSLAWQRAALCAPPPLGWSPSFPGSQSAGYSHPVCYLALRGTTQSLRWTAPGAPDLHLVARRPPSSLPPLTPCVGASAGRRPGRGGSSGHTCRAARLRGQEGVALDVAGGGGDVQPRPSVTHSALSCLLSPPSHNLLRALCLTRPALSRWSFSPLPSLPP